MRGKKKSKALGRDNLLLSKNGNKNEPDDLEIMNKMVHELDEDEKFDFINDFENLFGKKTKRESDSLFAYYTYYKLLKLMVSIYDELKPALAQIDSGESEIDHEIKLQLKKLKFFKINKPISQNALRWLKLIDQFSKFLIESYEGDNSLRNLAQFWNDEKQQLHPFMVKQLDNRFRDDVKHEVDSAGGRVDHEIYNLPMEEKFLRKSKYRENADKVIYKFIFNRRNINQFNRYAGVTGYEIICVVDIRKEVKSSEIKNYPLKKCVKIYYHNYCWYAVFLFQAFKGKPSDVRVKIYKNEM